MTQQSASTREEVVRPFRRRSETGDMGVNPPPTAVSRRVAQRSIGRGGARTDNAIRLDELDGTAERVERKRRIVRRSVLVSAIEDAVAGEHFPILDPLPADGAVAVENQRGPRVRHRRSSGLGGMRVAQAVFAKD